MSNVFITGATGNLGRVISKRLAQAGYSLDLAVNEEVDMELPENTDVKFHPIDLTNEADTGRLVNGILEDRSNIDLAVLIVGGFTPGGLVDVEVADIQKMINLNFNTAFNVVKPLLNCFKSSGNQGQIVLIGAKSGLDPNEGKHSVAYALSKAMIVYMSEIINAEFNGTNITSTVIAPSTINTPGTRNAMPEADFSSWVTPDEIADTILHVTSNAGKKLRNTILHMYGNA